MARRQRQQQETQQEQGFVQHDTGVSFSSGVMHVGGRPQRPTLVEHWMSSNGTTTYTTITWVDPNNGEKRTSCNCPGWAIARGGKRHCKHTKGMEGIAPCNADRVDVHAVTTAAQARELIPDLQEEGGRMLRGIF